MILNGVLIDLLSDQYFFNEKTLQTLNTFDQSSTCIIFDNNEDHTNDQAKKMFYGIKVLYKFCSTNVQYLHLRAEKEKKNL